MSRPACWRCPGGQRARRGLCRDRDEQPRRAVDTRQAPDPRVRLGHELPGYLASHREVFQDYGYWSFGELASYAATQDPNNCAPNLQSPTTRRPRVTNRSSRVAMATQA